MQKYEKAKIGKNWQNTEKFPVGPHKLADGEIVIWKEHLGRYSQPFSALLAIMTGEVHVDWWTETPDRSKVFEKARSTPIPFPLRSRSLLSSPEGGKDQGSGRKEKRGLSDITNSPAKPATTPARTLGWAMALLSENGESRVSSPAEDEEEEPAPVAQTELAEPEGSARAATPTSGSSSRVLRL